MNLRQQLDCLNDSDYNTTYLREKLEALFQSQRNYDIFRQGLENNCYVNTETTVSIGALCNLQVKNRQQAGTTVEQFVFTITDNYPEDKLLHVKITMRRAYKGGVDCYINQNDRHLDNNDIIECFKDCFGI